MFGEKREQAGLDALQRSETQKEVKIKIGKIGNWVKKRSQCRRMRSSETDDTRVREKTKPKVWDLLKRKTAAVRSSSS